MDGMKCTTSFILIVRSFTCRPNLHMGPIFLLAYRHTANSQILANLEPTILDLVSTTLTTRSRYKGQLDIVKQELNIILSCNTYELYNPWHNACYITINCSLTIASITVNEYNNNNHYSLNNHT